MFFAELYPSESRKLVERLVNYVIYKVSAFEFLWFYEMCLPANFIVIYYVPVHEQGTFLPLIVPPTLYQAGLWTAWLAVLCSLKVFILS